MFTSFSERLKQAAQAGVESFDSAGQALQKTVSQAHLPTEVTGGSLLPKLPSLPGLGVSTDVGRDASAGSPSRGSHVASPTGERKSIDSPRHSALANRLSSLVAGSPGGSPAGKTAIGRQPSRPSSPSPSQASSSRTRSKPIGPVDPASIPLPASPPQSPILSSTNSAPNLLSLPLTEPSFTISDSNPASSVGTPILEHPTLATGTSLFNTSRLGTKASMPSEVTSQDDAHDESGEVPLPADGSVSASNSAAVTKEDALPQDVSIDSSVLPPVVAAVEALPLTIPTDPSVLTSEYALLAERVAKANAILATASPMLTGGIDDTDALSGWLQMVNGKVEMGSAEMQRMAKSLQSQNSSLEELRGKHTAQSASSSATITQLREQLAHQERNLSIQADQAILIGSLRSDLSKAQTQAKDAEEKTSKAIALLKTVRSKLVKVEKERDEVEKTQAEDRNERSRMVDNLEKLRAEREKEVVNLRQGFEKEVAGIREKYERDLATKKGQWELEIITTKASHAKDLAAKSTRINTLSNTITALTTEKQSQFALLQQRQEEIEATKAIAEGHQTRMKELDFQLREAIDRASTAEDTVAELRRELQFSSHGPNGTPRAPLQDPSIPAQQVQDIPRLLSEANAKAEAKMADCRAQLSRLERDRSEAEEEHARQLRDRTSELERLRGVLVEKDTAYAESLARHTTLMSRLDAAEADKRALRIDIEELENSIRELREQQASRGDVEAGIREEMEGVREQLGVVQGELEEARNAAAQLRGNNRTLREEMRRIQSSAQLLERQRNPGVGYWSAGHQPSSSGSGGQSPAIPEGQVVQAQQGLPLSSGRRSMDQGSAGGPGAVGAGMMSPSRSGGAGSISGTGQGRKSSPAPSEVGSRKDDEEEVNLEYLRNVILQFLEHKEMRANLVRVLAVILRFTPQELRRLNAKLTS